MIGHCIITINGVFVSKPQKTDIKYSPPAKWADVIYNQGGSSWAKPKNTKGVLK
jgi:hypothetical protein